MRLFSLGIAEGTIKLPTDVPCHRDSESSLPALHPPNDGEACMKLSSLPSARPGQARSVAAPRKQEQRRESRGTMRQARAGPGIAPLAPGDRRRRRRRRLGRAGGTASTPHTPVCQARSRAQRAAALVQNSLSLTSEKLLPFPTPHSGHTCLCRSPGSLRCPTRFEEDAVLCRPSKLCPPTVRLSAATDPPREGRRDAERRELLHPSQQPQRSLPNRPSHAHRARCYSPVPARCTIAIGYPCCPSPPRRGGGGGGGGRGLGRCAGWE